MIASKDILGLSPNRRALMAGGYVVPEAARCVQCGICSYYCPVGIDVRFHVWRDESITHAVCLTCGECVARCPRGVLRFGQTALGKMGPG